MQTLLPKTIADPAKLLTSNSTNNNTGSGQIQRNETVTLRLAGVVTQVLPNGNLVVAARQEFRVNSELRELQVTGVIRPQDIASDNTVLHDRMAEARIAYGGRGELTDVQHTALGPADDGHPDAVLRRLGDGFRCALPVLQSCLRQTTVGWGLRAARQP